MAWAGVAKDPWFGKQICYQALQNLRIAVSRAPKRGPPWGHPYEGCPSARSPLTIYNSNHGPLVRTSNLHPNAYEDPNNCIPVVYHTPNRGPRTDPSRINKGP